MRPLGAQRIEEIRLPEEEFAPSEQFSPQESYLHSGESLGRHAREHGKHSPWLALYVPVAAIGIAVGALAWSSHLKSQVQQQNDSIAAMQRENQRLANSLEENTVEMKATGELLGERLGMTQLDIDKQNAALAARQRASQPAPGQLQPPIQLPNQPPSSHFAFPVVPLKPAPQPVSAASQPLATHQVAESARPTFPQLNSLGEGGRPELGVPRIGTVRSPLAAHSGETGATQPVNRPTAPAALSAMKPLAPVSNVPSPADQVAMVSVAHTVYGAPLAQNLASVAALQKRTTAPIEEFHVHEGNLTQPLPGLGLEVRRPDAKHGTYTLVVLEGQYSSEHKGSLNIPLIFAGSSGHRFQLVVLNIRDEQIYGYLTGLH